MIVRYDKNNQEHRDFIIQVMTEPSVMKGAGVQPGQEIDWLENADACYTLLELGVGVVFAEVYADGETVEVHSNFLPGKRGKTALAMLREVAEALFCATPVEAVLTYAQHNNKGAIGMCHLMGFKEIYRDDEKSYKMLRIEDWILNGHMVGADFVEACSVMFSPSKAMRCYNRAARLVRATPAVVDDEGVITVADRVVFDPRVKEGV